MPVFSCLGKASVLPVFSCFGILAQLNSWHSCPYFLPLVCCAKYPFPEFLEQCWVLSAREWLNVSSYRIPCWSIRLDGGQGSGAFLQPCHWFVKVSGCAEKFLNSLLTRLQLQENSLHFLFLLMVWRCYEGVGSLILIIPYYAVLSSLNIR